MKRLAINLAVLSTLGLASQAMATGFVDLPAPTGTNVSPYISCNTTGNFGSGDSDEPTSTTNNTCAVFPANRNDSPVSGYSTYLTRAGRNIVMNNAFTNNNNITVATMDERVWKKDGATGSNESCIYGARFTMANVDYWTQAGHTGKQTLEINGFARAGFSSFTGSGSLKIAYFFSSVSDEVLFRAGRTYTSVQHRATLADEDVPATGYVALPKNTNAANTIVAPTNTPVNGVNAWTSGSPPALPVPTTQQQQAGVDANWVEFTTDNNFLDDDGTSLKDSSQLYVMATGTNACPALSGGEGVITSNAYSFRQTGQEEAPFLEFKVDGYIPSGANVNINY